MNAPLRVIVCGSRDWTDEAPICARLRELPPGSTVIHGGARGADVRAGSVARALGFEVEVFHADWRRWGTRAGPIRNRRMLTEGKPDRVYAFNLGTPGTEDMMRQARKAGVEVIEVRP